MTSEMHLGMAEVLGTVHTYRTEQLKRRWWPVGPELVLGQMAAPALEMSIKTNCVFK
jgi:hypothetical protein